MKEAKFKIGDKVKSTWYGTGKVVDVLYSSHCDQYSYMVENNEHGAELFGEPELKLVEEKKEYSMDIKIDIAGNVLIATLYESVGGGTEAHRQRTWSSDPRRGNRHCAGRKLRLQQTLEENRRD